MQPLNLFYEEPDLDRWIPFDRYPRKFIRRLLRGKSQPGGVMMIALGLMKGLDILKIPYRFNDYNYIKKNPNDLVGLIGKPHVLYENKLLNPLILGSGIFSHPVDDPLLFEKYTNVKKFLVPGEWMRKMCESYYGKNVLAWPVGIDTIEWAETGKGNADIDFLVYDKIRWEYPQYENNLLKPVLKTLDEWGLSYKCIRYGFYQPDTLKHLLKKCKSVIFLCEHETQGQAYQQILSTNTPILAWDRGGYWRDPAYYPEKAQYEPVSSVPYWDGRCGLKFSCFNEFSDQLEQFLSMKNDHIFQPRQYILDNLTLEKCALKYVRIYNKVLEELS